MAMSSSSTSFSSSSPTRLLLREIENSKRLFTILVNSFASSRAISPELFELASELLVDSSRINDSEGSLNS